ncbi:MAG: hypothetical protein AUJ21_12590 [Anaerolineae bacterium CG1_02_58_13]|nr:MAG: hypothetical protein AUJ21_12590 [Anaerolineae bacterium CG1_02_58_13]
MTLETEITETQSNSRPSFVALCGRVFRSDPEFFPQAEYRGRTIYLCTDACLGAYLSDPERFVAAHKKSYKKTTSIVST